MSPACKYQLMMLLPCALVMSELQVHPASSSSSPRVLTDMLWCSIWQIISYINFKNPITGKVRRLSIISIWVH